MNKKTKIINILLILNLILIILIFLYFYSSNMGAFGYKVEFNNIVFVYFIINILLIVINKIRKINQKIKILLIIIFVIFSFVFPIYEKIIFLDIRNNSYLTNVNEEKKFNIYGIKIYEKK